MPRRTAADKRFDRLDGAQHDFADPLTPEEWLHCKEQLSEFESQRDDDKDRTTRHYRQRSARVAARFLKESLCVATEAFCQWLDVDAPEGHRSVLLLQQADLLLGLFGEWDGRDPEQAQGDDADAGDGGGQDQHRPVGLRAQVLALVQDAGAALVPDGLAMPTATPA